jgi:prephenate dehydrogenase
MPFNQITIIGTGLIGGSFGLAVKAAGFTGRIVGCDRPGVLERALSMGAIDTGVQDPVTAVQGSDLILLAIPVGAVIDLIERIGPIVSPGALITDTGSTKKEILDRARAVFGGNVGQRFLGGHPMAGKEHSGIEHADAEMLHNAVWFFVPQQPQDLETVKIKEYHELLEHSGLRVVVMDAERHDRLCGWTSHLPQMVATALAGILSDEFSGELAELHSIGSRGMKEITRTASSPYSMWRDIALTNAANLERALHALEQRIAHIRENLRSPGLREEFEQANRFAARKSEHAASVLVLPGWQNSGPLHWQTLWEKEFPTLRRVQQQEWDSPRREDWVKRISEEVSRAPGPIVFAAHSLGCIALAHWAQAAPDQISKIKGALLVAPADTDHLAPQIKGFSPVPLQALPFPSVVVASSNDSYLSNDRARKFARAWGSKFEDAGPAGHLNSESGLGDWPEGKRLIRNLMVGS